MTTVSVEYLIPYVRLEIGDMDPASYRYIDQWITTALIVAVKEGQRYWRSKYTTTEDGLVSRNPYFTYETDESEGVIEDKDEPILVILAALAILNGSLENSAWSTISWKDAEISYNNNEGGRIRGDTLKRLQAKLDDFIKAPTKRLAKPQGFKLPGFKSDMERGTDL